MPKSPKTPAKKPTVSKTSSKTPRSGKKVIAESRKNRFVWQEGDLEIISPKKKKSK